MSSWSKIVSDNIPEIKPVSTKETVPVTETKQVITVIRPFTQFDESVRERLRMYFKYRFVEFKSLKNGYISIREIVSKMNSRIYITSEVTRKDICYIVAISFGKEFEFHPMNNDMIRYVSHKK